MDEALARAITVVVVNRHTWHVDGQLFKVGAAMAVELRIQVREQPALQQRVLREVNAADHMARLEHDLLRLSEVVDRVAVQSEDSQLGQGHKFLGNDLGWVEHVEAEGKCLVFVEDLHGELPGWRVAGLDRIPKVLTMEVCVLARQHLSFFPHQAGLALQGLEMELDELGGAIVLDEPEGVHTVAVLGTISTCIIRPHVVKRLTICL